MCVVKDVDVDVGVGVGLCMCVVKMWTWVWVWVCVYACVCGVRSAIYPLYEMVVNGMCILGIVDLCTSCEILAVAF